MQELLRNISRFPKFLVAISFGIFFALFDRLRPLLRKPVTATALIGALASALAFLFFTLRAMLGYSVI
ncbi:MAG: DUF751 domain-containing protein [Cyanobacteria bacterium QS_8_64_29]|nr:MAG: DUF751 domain-containing protein [Cyanobacteria bacterium QS_8_64_29]